MDPSYQGTPDQCFSRKQAIVSPQPWKSHMWKSALKLAGMGILGLAIWLRMDPKMNHYVRAAYDQTDISSYHTICYILMSTGGVMTFIGFLGCCGAFQESKCMLGTFFCFLFLIFGAEVAGGGWAYMHRNQIESSITKQFKNLVQNYYGTTKDPLVDEAINFVQSNLQCCGGDKPADWHGSTWVQQDITDPNRVPPSCCKTQRQPKKVQIGICGTQNQVWINGHHPGVWDKGCGDALKENLQKNLFLMVVVALGIAGVQLFGMIFSLGLCCAMRRSRGGGYKS